MSTPSRMTLRGFSSEVVELVGTARRVWADVPRPRQLALLAAVALMTIGGAANTTLAVLAGKLVNRLVAGVGAHEPRADVLAAAVTILAGIAGMVMIREALQVLRRYLVESTCTGIERHLSVAAVSHIMRAELSALTHQKVGALHGRLFRGVDGYMRLLRLSFLDFLPALVIGALAIGTAVYQQPWLGLAMLAVIPASLSLTVWQLISQKNVRLSMMHVREELDGTVVEQLGGLDYVRVANTYEREVGRVARAAEHRRSKELGHHVAMSFFGAGKAVIEGFCHVGVLAFAAYLAVSGDIKPGDVFMFSMLFLSAMAPLNEVHRVLDQGHEASLQVADLQTLMRLPEDPSFKTPTHREARLDDAAPVVRCEGLRVDYKLPDGRTRTALNGAGLEIHTGETIGVAGRSGCGKSTWLKVLMRLIHPAAGRVWVKGMPLDEVSRETIAHLVGYVGQNPFVFHGTIEQNIAYGACRYLPEDVRRAARLACLDDEILAMPDGYQTIVAERGQNLSGGQRQRLALARVFLQNPPVLILDEATSALDTISERQVQQAIAAARRDRTVIWVAHRLSTFADADRIFVFDDGRITETGTYDELMAKNGLFAELARCSELSPDGGTTTVTVATPAAVAATPEPEPVGV